MVFIHNKEYNLLCKITRNFQHFVAHGLYKQISGENYRFSDFRAVKKQFKTNRFFYSFKFILKFQLLSIILYIY